MSDPTERAEDLLNQIPICGNLRKMADAALAAVRAEGRAEGAREEREACAEAVEGLREPGWVTPHDPDWNTALDRAAAAIRARGESEETSGNS